MLQEAHLIKYISSAGSGKTYTLVKEYLKIVLQNPYSYKNILAITFTNKATDEMKTRILDALFKLATDNFNILKQNLQLEFEKINLKIDIQSAAKKALQIILHNYSEFCISTIDSFFQRIIRNFAYELQLPSQYGIELNTDVVSNFITYSVLNEVGTSKAKILTKWLLKYTFNLIENDKGWTISKIIENNCNEIFKDSFFKNNKQQNNWISKEELLIEIEKWQKQKNEIENSIKRLKAKFDAIMTSHSLTKDDFARGAYTCVLNISEFVEPSVQIYKNLLEKGEIAWEKKGASLLNIRNAIENGLHSCFLEMVEYFNSNFYEYNTINQLLKHIYIYGIYQDLNSKLIDYRTQNQLLLISDSNQIINLIYEKSMGDISFIFDKAGTNFKHILIDEFQDTSDFQWANLKHLVINILAEGQSPFIVGDVKQAIYRWRSGNMMLLLEDVQKSLYPFKTIENKLDTNFRSQENIVLFNNYFFDAAHTIVYNLINNKEFENLKQAEQLKNAYSSLYQQVAPNKANGGYIKIKFIEKNSDPTIKTDFETENDSDEEESQLNSQIIEQIIDSINNDLTKTQNFNLQDIAILIRTNKEGVILSNALSEAGIKVVSSESLLIKNSLKIKLLISVLKFLNNSQNTIAQAEVLIFYTKLKKYFPNNEAYCEHFYELSTSHLQQNNELNFNTIMPKQFIDKLCYLPKLNLYELIEHLIELLNLNDQADAYLQRFQDVVWDFNNKTSASSQLFLIWWKDNCDKISIIVSKADNAVTIMTIHKAKGLEFPVVILPCFKGWKLKPNTKSIFWGKTQNKKFLPLGAMPLTPIDALKKSYYAESYYKELYLNYIDNINMLYVALTRPTERLYIFAETKNKKSVNTNNMSDLIFETLTNNTFIDKPLFNFENLVFEKGDKFLKTHSENAVNNAINLESYICQNFNDKIVLRSESEKYFPLFDIEKSKKVKLGLQIHHVLEKLTNYSQLQKVINSLIIKGLVSSENINTIQNGINQIFNKYPTVKLWFTNEWQVLSERHILQNNIRKVPDKVLLKGNKAIIIDFKTGIKEEKHLLQVKNYAKILTIMGYIVIEKWLLYIGEDPDLVSVL